MTTIRDLRRAREEARAERDAAREAFRAANHDGPVQTWEEYRRAEAAVRTLADVETQLRAAEADERFRATARACSGCGREHFSAGENVCWPCRIDEATSGPDATASGGSERTAAPAAGSRAALLDALDALV